jgi:hypothetical protein
MVVLKSFMKNYKGKRECNRYKQERPSSERHLRVWKDPEIAAMLNTYKNEVIVYARAKQEILGRLLEVNKACVFFNR